MQRAVVTQKMAWGKMLNDKIGYIRIENFHDGCADQFKDGAAVADRQRRRGHLSLTCATTAAAVSRR